MPGSRSIVYKKVNVKHIFKSNVFDKKQELKEVILKSLMEKEYGKVNFAESIDKAISMQNHLWTKFQIKFQEKHIRKHIGKLNAIQRIKDEEAERKR